MSEISIDGANLVRELEKIYEALEWTEKHLTTMNESNAYLHINPKVFYSPLTVQVHEARLSLEVILNERRQEESAHPGTN